MSFKLRDMAVAKAVIAVFESGKVRGNYSAVAVLRDGAGLSVGSHQATHKAGSLYKIVKRYVDTSSDAEAIALKAYLPALKNTTQANVNKTAQDTKLKNLLKAAGKNVDMQRAQDYVFKKFYLDPAVNAAENSGFKYALSLLVIFDSFVQGGFERIRDSVGSHLAEKAWIKQFCVNRRHWLETSPKQILHVTAVRPRTYLTLIEDNNWDLNTPLYINGFKITEEDVKFHENLLKEPEDVEQSQEEDNSSVVDDTATEQPTKDENTRVGEETKTDEPVEVTPAAAKKPEGAKSWTTTLIGWGSGLGISSVSFGSVFTKLAAQPLLVKVLIYLGFIGIAAAILFGITYLIIRAIHINRRETQAHELNLKQMELAADKNKNSVVLTTPKILYSNVIDESKEQ